MGVLPDTQALTDLDSARARIAELERQLMDSEAAHQQTKVFFQNVIDAIPARVFWKDRDSRFLGANLSFARDFGNYRPEDMIGKNDLDFGVPPDIAEQYQQDDQLVMEAGFPKQYFEEPMQTPDGKMIWLLTNKIPLLDSDQNVYGVLGTYRDITEHKEREIALEQARNELEEKVTELNAALIFKDQFLAIMSHELRTPLNAILGYSSLGLQMETMASPSPDKMRHMMQRIVANSERLLHLINEILDLSRINAGRVEIVQMPYDLHEIARSWYDDFQKRVNAKGLEFKFSLDESLPTPIIGDQERLSQIVTNLLENAIKFTETGSISLTIGRKGGDKMFFAVRDTGIGISPTWHNLIFEEFRRVEMDSVRRTGGAGLGLSIVQRLAKLMGGGVTVESELGAGSTFTITLPLTMKTEHSE